MPSRHENGAARPPERGVYCPVKATIELLQQKWALHIVQELIGSKKRFNELAQAVGGVNSRTLSERLRVLEGQGLVARRVLSQIPPWVEYTLTPKGRSLNTVVVSIARWGRTWMQQDRTSAVQAARPRRRAAGRPS